MGTPGLIVPGSPWQPLYYAAFLFDFSCLIPCFNDNDLSSLSRLLYYTLPMEQEEGAYANSTLLSMECQLVDQLNAVKPPLSLQESFIINDHLASGVISNNNCEHPDMQGSVIFDMLSAMQFSHPGAPNIDHTNNINISPHEKFNYMPADASSSWHLNLYHNAARAADNQDMDNNLSSKEQPGFDPVCFLKLPVLADQIKLGLDQRFNLPYINREDQYNLCIKDSTSLHDSRANGQYNGVSNSWFNSLQLETITSPRNCSDVIDEVQYHVIDGEEAARIKISNGEISFPIGGDGVDYSLQVFSNGEPYNDNQDAVDLAGVVHMINTKSSKRKRSVRGSCKNSEERESQRMTHIAVERNRRRQMNEHLRVLRALMPPSYVQRGDQASIIGGAIEFVRELEQLLQCLESQKRRRMMANPVVIMQAAPPPLPPPPPPPQQQSMMSYENSPSNNGVAACMLESLMMESCREEVAQAKSTMADIEVKLVDKCDALIKILSQRRPRQLLNTISALEDLHFIILHTNVTTIDNTVLYSFTVKVNNECDSTAEQIATSVHEIFIQLIQSPSKDMQAHII